MGKTRDKRVERWREIFLVSLRLGLTSFGGPVAHLAYFREAYVEKRKWLNEKAYADLIALCQFLPGPASSQVGISVGMMRGGPAGGLFSWLGFTLPSVVFLVLFAKALTFWDVERTGIIHGLKIAAVAVVAHAVWKMGHSLINDVKQAVIMIFTAALVLIWPTPWMQVALMVLAGAAGVFLFEKEKKTYGDTLDISIGRRAANVSLILFFALLAALPLAAYYIRAEWLALIDVFYRVGSLVFGGGHVVLPLLEKEVVTTGWVSEETFLAGYGAAQAIPGPLFTFAGFLGAAMNGWTGALVSVAAIFFPSFLLVIGILPYWSKLRNHAGFNSALYGIHGAVVGLLLAALYHPVWTGTIAVKADFCLAFIAYGLLAFLKVPSWAVVIVCAVGGYLISGFM